MIEVAIDFSSASDLANHKAAGKQSNTNETTVYFPRSTGNRSKLFLVCHDQNLEKYAEFNSAT